MRRSLRDDRGQAIVIMGLAFTGILAVGGLAIDAGLEYVERRHEQVAADSAAWAAAVSLTTNWNASGRATLARTAALDYANRNGYNNDGTTNTVTVNIPPTSGGYSGNSDYAEVIISVNVRTAFIRVLGSSFQTRQIQGRAVGGIVSPPKSYAIIALSKTASPSFTLTGQAEVEAENVGILVNSSASGALSTTSQTQIEASNGGVDVVGTASCSPLPNCQVNGTLRQGQPQQSDPLAYLTPPDGTGMTTYAAVNVSSGTTTLSPGIYPSISASGSANVRLSAGTYVIKGGGLSVSGNAKIEDNAPGDSGVFIYNACSSFPATGGSCGGVSVSGNGRFKLEKSTTGTYAGISFWQSCDNTQTMSVVGGGQQGDDSNGEFETTGTVYLPCAAVSVAGHGELEIEQGQLVALTVSAVGNSEIEVEWESSSSQPNRSPALVE